MLNHNDYHVRPEPNTLVLEDRSLRHGFVQLPKLILYARTLSRDAKLLFAVLLGYAWEKESCFPGYRRLCQDMQASENMVRKYMRELEAVGLLSQQRRGLGKTNIYTLHDLRTAKLEVLEPQRTDAPEPTKSAGKGEPIERKPDVHNSKNRNGENLDVFSDAGNGKDDPTTPRHRGDERSSVPVSPGSGIPGSLRAGPARVAHGGQRDPVALGERLNGHRGRLQGSSEDRQVIVAYLDEVARELNDRAPLRISVKRAMNLLERSGVPRTAFIQRLFEARSLTRERSAANTTIVKSGGSGVPVKAQMAYFFAVLEDLLHLADDTFSSVVPSSE